MKVGTGFFKKKLPGIIFLTWFFLQPGPACLVAGSPAAPKGVFPMEERIPFRPRDLRFVPLRNGIAVHEFNTGGRAVDFAPFYVIGMDPVSLKWFRASAQWLKEHGAYGIVVAADTPQQWRHLEKKARTFGLEIFLANGDELMKPLGIKSYPVIIMSSEKVPEYNKFWKLRKRK